MPIMIASSTIAATRAEPASSRSRSRGLSFAEGHSVTVVGPWVAERPEGSWTSSVMGWLPLAGLYRRTIPRPTSVPLSFQM